LAILGRLGAATISTDALVHELYGSPAVRDAVVARFGQQVAPGGVVDRAALAQRIFSADAGADRDWLERLLWPLVRQRVDEWRAAALAGRGSAPVALVVEVPLLFESGSEGIYDATIAVVADEQLRVARSGNRDHHRLAEREQRQLAQADKASRATYVVLNDGDLTELEAKLSEILVMLQRRWSQP
jgi:dephospho-CoA kinase